MIKQNYRRLPLAGLDNCRDLGGYPTPDGITKYGVCLRSEVPTALTESDMQFMKDYGLTTVIDLRAAPEAAEAPYILKEQPWVNYSLLPLFNDAAAPGVKAEFKPPKPRRFDGNFAWSDEYISMAEEHKPWIRAVMETIADAEGAVLYHCTTGKDRTGIISALLLRICGVSEEDAIADYAVSQIYLRKMYLSMRVPPEIGRGNLSSPFFSTAPSNMMNFLAHIKEKYGDCVAYLRACGVSDETLEALRAKLIERNQSRIA